MKKTKITSVYIIDDHYFFRTGLAQFLQNNYDDLFSVQHTTCDEDGLQLAESKNPELVFLGLNAIKSDTLMVAVQLVKNLPKASFIAFADLATDKGLQHIYRSGRNGVLLKSDFDSDLDTAIASYISKKKYASKAVLENYMMPETNSSGLDFNTIYETVLTLREKQMLELLRLGYTNKEAAHRMNIDDKTGYNHRYKLMTRFNVKTYAELIRIAEKSANKPSMFKDKGSK